jgi:hypothetical protein
MSVFVFELGFNLLLHFWIYDARCL